MVPCKIQNGLFMLDYFKQNWLKSYKNGFINAYGIIDPIITLWTTLTPYATFHAYKM